MQTIKVKLINGETITGQTKFDPATVEFPSYITVLHDNIGTVIPRHAIVKMDVTL